jgi:hypothetical protein
MDGSMSETFHLLDLPSQALAVQRLLSGCSESERLSWLAARGKIVPIEMRIAGVRPVYMFESVLGLRCAFFISGDGFVFFGDHTAYTVRDSRPIS